MLKVSKEEVDMKAGLHLEHVGPLLQSGVVGDPSLIPLSGVVVEEFPHIPLEEQ